jgi:hypothetical protein
MWWRSSSPPAPTSMPRTTTGKRPRRLNLRLPFERAARPARAGGRYSCWPRFSAILAWSSCSSPPAPRSPPRTTAGKATAPHCYVHMPLDHRKPTCARRVTALQLAAQNGHARVVELLIAAGANVAAWNDYGYGSSPKLVLGVPSDRVRRGRAHSPQDDGTHVGGHLRPHQRRGRSHLRRR